MRDYVGCAGAKVGDASASQSPLSFGGFGNMLRHLARLDAGLNDALRQDRLSRQALSLLQVSTTASHTTAFEVSRIMFFYASLSCTLC
jgi:hypothetical protein